MTVRAGQLRMWIARDEAGGTHEMEFGDSLFMIINDPYENEFGQRMVDILENGMVYEFMDSEHIDFWSVLVNE